MERQMKDEKKDKRVVQLDEERKNKEYKKVDIAPSRKIEKPIISFDVYFQILMRKNARILAHHKAPMRNYAESNGLKKATKEDFDRIFRLY